MDSNDLSAEQVERLGGDVRRNLRYLNRLCERMIRLGLPVNDPLQIAAVKARAAMQDLARRHSMRAANMGLGGRPDPKAIPGRKLIECSMETQGQPGKQLNLETQTLTELEITFPEESESRFRNESESRWNERIAWSNLN